MKNEVRARYWDSLAFHYAKRPEEYKFSARRDIKQRISKLKHELSILEELAEELK